MATLSSIKTDELRIILKKFSRNGKPRLRNTSSSLGEWMRICERMPVPRQKNIILVRPEVDQNKGDRNKVDRQLASTILNKPVSCVTLLKLLRQKSKIVLLSLCFAFIEVILYIWIKIFAFYQTNYTHQIIISTFNPQHHIYDRLFQSSWLILHRIFSILPPPHYSSSLFGKRRVSIHQPVPGMTTLLICIKYSPQHLPPLPTQNTTKQKYFEPDRNVRTAKCVVVLGWAPSSAREWRS